MGNDKSKNKYEDTVSSEHKECIKKMFKLTNSKAVTEDLLKKLKMGNEKPKNKYEDIVSPEQKECIMKMFKLTNSKDVTEDLLKMAWKHILSEGLLQMFISYLFRSSKAIGIQDLELFFYKMVEGSTEDRATILIDLVQFSSESNITTYVSDLLESYLNILEQRFPEKYQSWNSSDPKHRSHVDIVSQYLVKDLHVEDGKLSLEEVEKWLHQCSFVKDLSDTVFKTAFGVGVEEFKPCLPKADKHSRLLSVPVVLSLSQLIRLPSKEWRLIYSSSDEAHSWNILQNHIFTQGPTLLLIEDTSGNVFGGFASQSWKLSPNFYGDENCFLFTILPEFRICLPTGYNSNFQYMNHNATTLPNGLGMGGQINYFGFFLSSEFGPATVSESCTTFRDFKQPVPTKEFTFSHVEFWGVGEPDVKLEGGRQFQVTASGLVMDRDPCATAILEMAGRTCYSKNLTPEPEPTSE